MLLVYAATPRIPYRWRVVNGPRIGFSELREATEYVVSVVSIRGPDSGSDVATLIAWTTWKNSLQAKWSDWTAYSEVSLIIM